MLNNKKSLIIHFILNIYKKGKKKITFKCNKYFILLLNIIVFSVNVFFLEKQINIKFSINFNNVDKFPLFFTSKTYKFISNKLISKYFLFRSKNTFYHNNKKEKIISIDCIDFLNNSKDCLNEIKEKFKEKNIILKLNTNNPDYIIYDVFGCEHTHIKYKNSVKIAYYSENIIPDFNVADYALSQTHFNYFDRHFKYPSFIWNLYKLNKYDIIKIRNDLLNNPNRTKFCAAVISNQFSDFRLNFIDQLNKYKTVDMGGKSFNNIGGNVVNKINFLSSYKFSIAMENSEGDGYISEKIIDAFIAGTIPIYYGSYMLDEYINPKAYILIKDNNNIKKKIEYIKKIDSDNELYKSILKENIFLYDDIEQMTRKEFDSFFYNIFSSILFIDNFYYFHL